MKNSIILLCFIFILFSCNEKKETSNSIKTMNKNIFELKDTTYYVSISDTINNEEVLTIHEKLHYSLLTKYNNIQPYILGPTFAKYPSNTFKDSTIVEYGFFTSKKIQKEKGTSSTYLPLGTYAFVVFKGEYFNIDKNIQRLNLIINENNYQASDDYFEIYYLGPHNKPNTPSQWETEIRVPVKSK